MQVKLCLGIWHAKYDWNSFKDRTAITSYLFAVYIRAEIDSFAMSTHSHSSGPHNVPPKAQQRIQEELRTALRAVLVPMLRPILGGFLAASKEVAEQQALQFKNHSDEIFLAMDEKLKKMEKSMSQKYVQEPADTPVSRRHNRNPSPQHHDKVTKKTKGATRTKATLNRPGGSARRNPSRACRVKRRQNQALVY